MNCKLAGREQLAAQGVPGRQVHKGVADGSAAIVGLIRTSPSPAATENKTVPTTKPAYAYCGNSVGIRA